MKSFLWRIPLALIGLAGIGTGLFGIWSKVACPVPWGENGIMLVGWSLAVMPVSICLIWASTWDVF